ncbi:Concanavalin A-like lectin/glucanase domain,EGF-like domain,Laminin G domain [Cinara cedri]|uniref:Concanavalin A-like lectin/glucanase domain,EGF-like domain,Laminin G domain n=1 Tax=Cinara cedri TaxID=506608 RepID=A0A5E4NFL5_9HEMI|nr:Concanavalin A-like lectin/glucanase domain,EGF-like domain,Laminin G domain [Cinara cedri]
MAEASFTGEEFLKYVFDGNTEGDSFVLHFKTKQPAGLLYHIGDGSSNYLNVGIVTGGISVTMRVGTGSLDMFVKPNRIRFDDNQWHKISVTRKIQGISAVTSFCKLAVTVDEVYGEQGSSAGAFTSLSLGYLYLGGSENTVALPGTKASTNFVGCIRKVEYTSDGVNKYDFLEMGKTGISSIQVFGRLQFSCQDFGMDDPVCLSTSRSFLMLPNWDGTTSGSISVKFRTNEPDGLLFFSRGQTEHTSGIYAVEMVDGRLYVYLDLGAGGTRAEVTSEKFKVNDGLWHEFSIWRNDRDIHCTVDDYSSDFTTNGDSNQLHLQNGIMLGFGGRAIYHKKVPPGVWTLSLETGFVGCIRDLVLDGVAINLVSLSLEQDHVSITSHCPEFTNSCKSNTCYNGGICHEGWNRVMCDCSNTEYSGATCMRESSMYGFNGTQYVQAIMPDKMSTQVEDMFFRFKTNRPLAMLMKTFDSSWDRLEIALIVGKIRLALKIGETEKVVLCGSHLDDNNWHSVHYIRRGHEIRLKVDNVTEKNDTDMGDKITLKWQGLLVGGTPPKDPDSQSALPSFIGSIQQFTLNNINYFDLAKISTRGYAEDLPKVHMTSKYQKQEKPPSLVHTVTFLSKNTFIGLPPLKAYSRMEVYFRFKTKHTSGLFFYNGGKHNDFALAELINGHLLINIRSGTHVIRLRDASKNSYNDNYWHSVHLLQVSATMFCLLIDDQAAATTTISRPHNIQLSGMFYVGGVPKELHKRQSKHIHSRHGFEGCMSGLEYNGESPDVVENATIPSTFVTAGCDGSNRMCTQDMCDNHGTCVEQWNSYSCDCDMTAYVGPTCSEPSVSYEFGQGGGLVTYAFSDGRQPDMQNDKLALGFITSKPNGVLFRVESRTSGDFLQLEVINGHIVVVYNVGTNDHPIGEANVYVNDNSYHLVRFVRSGPNSTLQVDDNSMQTLYPSGHQLSVFNEQSTVQVGGRWNKTKQRIDDAFEGVMVGLVYNGLRVFDLAANRDPRTSNKGDVQQLASILDRLNEHSLLDTMQQTPASGVMDDLVYSGAGSGCNHDDEDQCTVLPFDGSSGDDLITPVYVPPTVVPPPGLVTNVPGACDDEETDCITGSGFGPTTFSTDETVVTTKSAHGAVTATNNRTTVKQPGTKSTETAASTAGPSTNQTEQSKWSPTTAKTTAHSRGPGTAVTGTTVTTTASGTPSGTTADNNKPSSVSGDGNNATTSQSPDTTSTIANASTAGTTRSTFYDGTKDTKSRGGDGGGGGGYNWGVGGGHRPGGYDERDGETMMTTPNLVYGGDNFVPAAEPTPPKNTEPPINTKAAESTAFVVLVTAATLIIIVLIILIVLKVKYRTDTNRYKIEMPKAYAAPIDQGSDRGGLCQQQQQHQQQHQQHHQQQHHHHQNANLLSPGNYPSSRLSSPTYVQNNYRPHGGSSGGSAGSSGIINNKPKKRQDVKEWYV